MKRYRAFVLFSLLALSCFYSSGSLSLDKSDNSSADFKMTVDYIPNVQFNITNVSLLKTNSIFLGFNISYNIFNPSNTSIKLQTPNLCCPFYIDVGGFPSYNSTPFYLGGPDYYNSPWPTIGTSYFDPGNLSGTTSLSVTTTDYPSGLPDGTYYFEISSYAWGNYSKTLFPVKITVLNSVITSFSNYKISPFDYFKLAISLSNIQVTKINTSYTTDYSSFSVHVSLTSKDNQMYYPHLYSELLFPFAVTLTQIKTNESLKYNTTTPLLTLEQSHIPVEFDWNFTFYDHSVNLISFPDGQYSIQLTQLALPMPQSNILYFELKNGIFPTPNSTTTQATSITSTSSFGSISTQITSNNISSTATDTSKPTSTSLDMYTLVGAIILLPLIFKKRKR